MSEPTTSLPETVLDPRAPRYSRPVLQYFRTHSTAVATLDELAAAVSDERDEDERQVAIRLHHVTLPKLAETGVLDYDGRTNTARYRGDEVGDDLTEETVG